MVSKFQLLDSNIEFFSSVQWATIFFNGKFFICVWIFTPFSGIFAPPLAGVEV